MIAKILLMFNAVKTITITNQELYKSSVECLTLRGLPNFYTSGSISSSTKESLRKVISVCRSIIGTFPAQKIRTNITPTTLLKQGTHYDLPFAICLLKNLAPTMINKELLTKNIYAFGEINLNGDVTQTHGLFHFLQLYGKNIESKDLLIIPHIPIKTLKLIGYVFPKINFWSIENIHQLRRDITPQINLYCFDKPAFDLSCKFCSILDADLISPLQTALNKKQNILILTNHAYPLTNFEVMMSKCYLPTNRHDLLNLIKAQDQNGIAYPKPPISIINETIEHKELSRAINFAYKGFIIFKNIFEASSATLKYITKSQNITIIAIGALCPCANILGKCVCTNEDKINYYKKIPSSLYNTFKIIKLCKNSILKKAIFYTK